MDTIELTFKHRDDSFLMPLFQTIKEGMDKRKRRSTTREKFDGVIYKGYKTQERGYFGKGYFILACEPSFGDKPYTRIAFHCDDFDTYCELETWLKSIFKENYSKLRYAKVNRLDLCMDLFIPFHLFYTSVYQDRINSMVRFQSTSDSMYLGKKPRTTVFYEKKVGLYKVDNPEIKFRKTENEITCTRIEVRHWGYQVPIKNFFLLKDVVSLNPFSHLKFKDIHGCVDDLTPKIVKDFRKYAMRVGFPVARRDFNEHRNYSKYIGQYLEDSDINLVKAWRHRCNRFFK